MCCDQDFFFQSKTCQTIVFLTQLFERVDIVKPVTSRPGSAEKYIVCEGFRKLSPDERIQLTIALQIIVEERKVNSTESSVLNESFMSTYGLAALAHIQQVNLEASYFQVSSMFDFLLN